MKEQNRIAICPECGTGNEKHNREAAYESEIGFAHTYEIRRLEYRCIVCNTLFEHELKWMDGRIVSETVEMISFKTNPYFFEKGIGEHTCEFREGITVDCFKDDKRGETIDIDKFNNKR